MAQTLTLVFGAGNVAAQTIDSAAIAQVVAAQARVERGLHLLAGERPGDPQVPGQRSWDVTIERIELDDSPAAVPVAVFRAEVWALLHWHKYTVAVTDGRIWRLGGFVAPEVVEYASALGLAATTAEEAWSIARLLARLLDRTDAQTLVFLQDSATSGVDSALAGWWGRNRPESWPIDGVAKSVTGGLVVQVTALRRVSVYSATLGRAYAYRFEFAETGELVAWAYRVEEGSGPLDRN